MINPSSLQNISQLLILIGIIATALGGFGSYYFGKKSDATREKEAQTELSEAKQERKELKDMLEPFITYAQEKYPNEADSSALSMLADDIKNLKQQTEDLKKKTDEVEKKVKIWRLTNEQIEIISKQLIKHVRTVVRGSADNSSCCSP